MRKLLLLIGISLYAMSADAQWQFNGPHDPTTFLGGSSFFLTTANASGTYSTFDEEDPQWNFVEDSGLTTNTITSFVVYNNAFFIEGSGQGIFIAKYPVKTWTMIDSGLTSKSITALATNNVNLIAGTLNNGVFFSADTGKLWIRVNNGLADSGIISLAMGSNDTIFAATGHGVFLSPNNGASWVTRNKGLSDSFSITKLILSRGDTLFATTAGGVFLSTNSGANWVAKNDGLTNTNIISIISNTYAGLKATIYVVAKGSGIFMSTDNGSTWSAFNNGLIDSDVVSVALAGWQIYAGTNNNGVMGYNIFNGHNIWAPFNNGIPGDSVAAVTFLDSSIYIGTLQGVYVSNDNGGSWAPRNNGLRNTDVFSLAEWRGNLFAGTSDSGVFVSTDKGNTWTQRNDSLKGYPGSGIIATALTESGSNVYAGTISGGVFVSTDTGKLWKSIGLVGAEITSLAANDSIIFASTTATADAYLTTNEGRTWTAAAERVPLYATAISGNHLFVLTGRGDTIEESSDYGATWQVVYVGDFNMIAAGDSEIFAGGPDGIVASSNNGASWQSDNNGLPGFTFTVFAVNGANVYAAVSGEGLWSQSLTQLVNAGVWPGDANEDLTADNYDLLPIGLYYGDTGTARDTTTIVWAPHTAADWDSLQANGVNRKFVDCNGDGTINATDTLAIVQNYDLTHPFDAPRGTIERTSGTVPLSIVADSASYHAGSMVHASVMLGSSSNQATNIYGLAYDITFDASNIEPGTLTFNYNNGSFLGTKNTNALVLTQLNNDVETAITGIDHTNKTGYGKIGDLYFTLDNSSAGQLELSISTYEAVDAKGNEMGLLLIGDTVTVTTGVSQLSGISNQVSVYPNPFANDVFVKVNPSVQNVKDWTLQITDELGRIVYKTNSLNYLNDIDMSKLPCAMYYISVTGGTGSSVFPVVKQE